MLQEGFTLPIKKIVLIVLAVFIIPGLFLAPPASGALPEIGIYFDGQRLVSDVPPVLINNRTMVPLRIISESMGQKVFWDGENRRVIITAADEGYTPPPVIGMAEEIQIYLDGRLLESDVPPYIKQNRTMVPLRVISEELGLQVNWDGERQAVEINTPPLPPSQPIPSAPTLADTKVDYYLTIMGDATVGADQLKGILRSNNPQASEELVDLYLRLGREYGVRGDIAFCQAAKETGWWKFGGLVEPYQNNYCGLGATGSPATGEEELNGADPERIRYEAGVHGAIFDCMASGVEAHIQHLYAYACKDPLPATKTLVDPRFVKPARGIAPRWVDLGGRWAVPGYDRGKYASFEEAFSSQETYGHSILRDYYLQACEAKS